METKLRMGWDGMGWDGMGSDGWEEAMDGRKRWIGGSNGWEEAMDERKRWCGREENIRK